MNSISPRKIKILKKSEEVGSSRDWLVGQDDLERRLISILAKVFKISLRDLALELAMRPDSLLLALRKLEQRGLVVVEMAPGSSEVADEISPRPGHRSKRGVKDRSGKSTFVRFLGFQKEPQKKRDDRDIMYG